MVNIPTLVQDLSLTKLTNSVYVGTMKFTIDTVDAFEHVTGTEVNPKVWTD